MPGAEPPPRGTPARSGPERVRARYRRLLGDAADPHEWAYAWRTELNRGGFRAAEFLIDEVVAAGKCVGCASCVTICPTDVFDYAREQPVDARGDACVRCVLCAEVCPVLRPVDNDLGDLVGFCEPGSDDGYGRFGEALYARAADPAIRARGQDGGMVSALLIHHLETGRLGGAVLGDVEPDNRQIGRHKLATTRAEVLACAGSRYTYSPNTLALREALRHGVSPLAVVGVPCQVDGVRLQQNSSLRLQTARWYRDNIALVIGLFCSEAFTHESIQRLAALIDVAPERIANINIKGKVVVRLDDGEVVTSSLREYRRWARPACLYCLDYSAENADLAAGGIGRDGWTFTLVRSDAGRAAVEAAVADGWLETSPLETHPRGAELLRKLAAAKKRNRPLPALMPTLDQRAAQGHLDPKTYYTTGPGASSGPAREGP